MALPLMLDVALTHLSGRKRQTVVSILGVSLGVGFFIAMAALMQGFQGYFVSTVIDVSPHITISDEFRAPSPQPVQMAFAGAAQTIHGVRPRDDRRGIKRGLHIAEALARLPGVTVAPVLQGQIFLRYGSLDGTAALIGIDPDRERRVTRLEQDMVQGSLDALKTRTDGVVIGIVLARKLGAGLGDTLHAVSPVGVQRNLTVAGIFSTGITAVDDGQVYVPLKQAQILAGRPNTVNRIRLRLTDVAAAQDLAARIERRFAYKAESWQEANQNIFRIFRIQNAIMYSTVGAILVVASFGIFNIISTVVFEKSRDIAILKSLGFREGDIRRIFLIEGLLVGLTGAMLGWAVGYGLVQILASIRFDVAGGAVQNDRFHLAYSLGHYAFGGLFALASSGFAAWLPARRAAGLNPVDIVRGAA